jgi:hypothetical protein
LIASKGRWLIALALFVLAVAANLFTFLPAHSSKQVQPAWGICRGFGTKPIDAIPVEAIKAASVYLKTHMALGVLSYALPVDPFLESSVPHRCVEGPGNIDPYSPDQVLTDKKYIAELAARRLHYSGVIPPGATRALRISVMQTIPRPNYTGSDPVVVRLMNSSSLVASSDLIVAYYPKRGWVGVFKFPEQGGWPAYP